MALRTKVKVGSITNLSDARYCAGMGVDMLGFPVQMQGDETLNLKAIKEITGWVSVPEFVLELTRAAELDQLEELHSLFTFQLPAAEIPSVTRSGINLIASLGEEDWPLHKSKLLLHAGNIPYLLLMPSRSHDALTSTIREISADFNILLRYSPALGSLEEMLRMPIAGIALEGSQEIRPGLKDYGQLAEILEKLEEA